MSQALHSCYGTYAVTMTGQIYIYIEKCDYNSLNSGFLILDRGGQKQAFNFYQPQDLPCLVTVLNYDWTITLWGKGLANGQLTIVSLTLPNLYTQRFGSLVL